MAPCILPTSPLFIVLYTSAVFLISHFPIISASDIIASTLSETNFEAAFQGECRSNGPCQHLCFDLHDGTFECACKDGFTLANDGYSCIGNQLLEEEHWNGFEIKTSPSSSSLSSSSSSSSPSSPSSSSWQSVKFTVPSFNGTSYLEFPELGLALNLYFDIQMVFKPRALNGLLLYKGHRMNGGGDFVSINLIDGYVEFRFDPGNGPAVIKSLEPVKLNRWHKLTASRTSRLGTLLVDDQPEVGGYALGAFNQLSLPLNLFVGGVSDIQYVSRDSGLTSSFQGCIETIAINGRSIMLAEEALFIENVTECHHSP